MPDLYGVAAGLRMADIDNQASQMNAMNLATKGVELETMKTTLAQNQAMVAAMKNVDLTGKPDGGVGSMSDSLRKIGMIALKTGQVEKGRELFNSATTMDNNQSLIERRKVQSDLQQSATYGRIIDGVDSPQGWAQANALIEMETGKPSPFANLPYDQDKIDQLKLSLTSAKDRAVVSLDEQREKTSKAAATESTARLELIAAQTKVALAREKNYAKAGGKPVPSSYISAMKDAITDQYAQIGNMNPGTLGTLARPVAEEAYNIAQSEGISLSEATAKAFKDAQARGDFGGWSPTHIPGGHADNPIVAPVIKDKKAGTTKIDSGKLAKNKYYTIPSGKYAGQVLLWNGKGFEDPKATPAKDDEAMDSEDDEDGDE